MKTAAFCFLIFSLNVSSQDSSRHGFWSEKFCTLRLCPFPIFYGAFWGGGIVVNVEKGIVENHSICLGGKYLTYTDLGGYLGATHKLLIFEYRYHLGTPRDDPYYVSPYVKLRELNFFEVLTGYSPRKTKYYNENSIGLGFTCGKIYYINKKRSLELNPFLGAGYFFRLNYSNSFENVQPSVIDFVPSSIYRSFDLRVGCLVGINFKK